jgi:ribosome-binding protein aMBF1 (putative translation factor)
MSCELCMKEMNDMEYNLNKIWTGLNICMKCTFKHKISTDDSFQITKISFEDNHYTPDQWQRILKLKAFL